ncbi:MULTISPECIES: hypothetical protein [unclassified Brevundimonas]|uniref:hypothetical protein n=1 Tax=unclassified Brevundimonas TaxID=2622653 RepID=UPI0025C114D5|nr:MULTISPECIES: hypothetical protein [unclassified Brevundimonas]
MITTVIAALILGMTAKEQASPVPVSELRGLSVSDAVRRLGATRDPAPAISMIGPQGWVDVYPVQALTPPAPRGQVCDVRLVPPERADYPVQLYRPNAWAGAYPRTAAVYVVARDGRVVEVLNPPMRAQPPRAQGESAERYTRRLTLEGRDPWLSVAPGRLPLSDLDGFLERRPDLATPAEAVVKRACQRAPIILAKPSTELRADTTGVLQGLALLPFAWRLPALNEQRREAQVRGSALFARMRLGEVVPGGSARFAAENPGVRSYVDAEDPAYEVLSIDMGAEASNNLARMNAAALVGVRDGRVVWLADGGAAAGLGLLDSMCVDGARRATDHRPGCSNTGYFYP